jgi:hypothetical protein
MTHAEAIRDFIAPLLPAHLWAVQFGRWHDDKSGKRYAVVRPAGGDGVELVRRPQFTLSFVGLNPQDAASVLDTVNEVIEAMRVSSGALVFMQPGEPVFLASDDGRPIFELAVSAITS